MPSVFAFPRLPWSMISETPTIPSSDSELTLVQGVAEVHGSQDGQDAQVELQDQPLLMLVRGERGALDQLGGASRDIFERGRLRRDLVVYLRAAIVCSRHDGRVDDGRDVREVSGSWFLSRWDWMAQQREVAQGENTPS